MRRLHGQMFFLYGTIAGLAIREAFVRVGPTLVSFLSSTTEPWKIHLEATRLAVFFFAISTFYVGSVAFFDKCYISEDAGTSYPRSKYAYDFWFGLIHFVLFFLCAITINDFARTKSGLSLFLIYLASVFLYDLLWLYINRGQDTFEEIKVWAWSSAAAIFLAWVAFLIAKHVLSLGDVIAEYASLAIIAAYLLIDLAELLTGNQYISLALVGLLPKKIAKTPPSSQ